MSLFKRKEEILEQFVLDIQYDNICPICSILVSETIHQVFDISKRPEDKIIAECLKCSVAVYLKKTNTIKSLQRYRFSKSAFCNLELISQEVVLEDQGKA